MDIVKISAPGQKALCIEATKLWRRVFGGGISESEMNAIFGGEREYNTDNIYLAMEDGAILGTCRSIIPKNAPWLAGVCEVCTAPEARGRGVSHVLLGRMTDELGDVTAFLGTENPIAAKLYSGHGFSFVTGSNVMVRTKKSYRDFNDEYFAGDGFSVAESSPAFKVPVIPLCLFRGSSTVMDVNAGIISTDKMTQRGCFGIYACYERVLNGGGIWLAGLNGKGNMCASATAMQVDGRWRIDGFAHPDYEKYLPELLEAVTAKAGGEASAAVSTLDSGKEELFHKLGYKKTGEEMRQINGVYFKLSVMNR